MKKVFFLLVVSNFCTPLYLSNVCVNVSFLSLCAAPAASNGIVTCLKTSLKTSGHICLIQWSTFDMHPSACLTNCHFWKFLRNTFFILSGAHFTFKSVFSRLHFSPLWRTNGSQASHKRPQAQSCQLPPFHSLRMADTSGLGSASGPQETEELLSARSSFESLPFRWEFRLVAVPCALAMREAVDIDLFEPLKLKHHLNVSMRPLRSVQLRCFFPLRLFLV